MEVDRKARMARFISCSDMFVHKNERYRGCSIGSAGPSTMDRPRAYQGLMSGTALTCQAPYSMHLTVKNLAAERWGSNSRLPSSSPNSLTLTELLSTAPQSRSPGASVEY